MTITAATSADWVDFWENELTVESDMDQDQITAMPVSYTHLTLPTICSV